MIGEDGEEIPFEELDGCCQKEVLSKRRHKAVTAKLRVGDKSFARIDERNRVLKNVWKESQCPCCKDSQDYELLAKLRARRDEAMFCSVIDGAAGGRGSEPLSDSESDSDFDDDILASFENDRKMQFEMQRQKFETAQSLGFACHLEDSIDHISSEVALGLPIVVHIYNAGSLVCGKLDLLMEALSMKYIGTRFRRLAYSGEVAASDTLLAYGVQSSSFTARGSILCFQSKFLKVASATLEPFVYEDDILEGEVERFLSAAHMLEQEPPNPLMFAGTIIAPPEEEDDEQVYCEDPDCTRRYPHEHIGRKNVAGVSSVPSFLLDITLVEVKETATPPPPPSIS
jgi:hypothetical protein